MSSTTLFALLDRCVAADAGPPGFSAKIAIGILEDEHVDWWLAELGARAATSRPKHTPDGCDTVLLLGGEEVKTLLEGRALKTQPNTCTLIGDPRVLFRFNRRYLDRKNAIAIRLGAKS